MVSVATSIPSGCRVSWWVWCLCSMLTLHLMWGLSQLPAETSGAHSVGQLHLWLLSPKSWLYHGDPLLGLSAHAVALAPSTPPSTHRYPKNCVVFLLLVLFVLFFCFFESLIPKRETENKLSRVTLSLTELLVLALFPVPGWVSLLLRPILTYTPHI